MVCVLLYEFGYAGHHLLLRVHDVVGHHCVVFVAVPHLHNIFRVEANTILIDGKIAIPSGKALKSVEALVVEVEDIGEGYVGDILEGEWHSLEVELA